MECAFHVGQKVVCVNDRNWRGGDTRDPCPENGGVYTIAKIGVFSDGEIGLVLREFPKRGDPGQPDYLASRFRPVVERNTDISIFERLLNPNNHDLEVAQ